MEASRSEYYPPRAGRVGWVRTAWTTRCSRIRRWKRWIDARFPLVAFCLVVFIPAYGFFLRRGKWIGRAAGVLWLVSFGLALALLGTTAGTVATGFMVAIHAVGAAMALGTDGFFGSRRGRLVDRVLTSFVILGLFYVPMSRVVRAVAFPLETADGVVVVNRLGSPRDLKIGDAVAFIVHRQGRENYAVPNGYVLDPILALPGDEIRFGESFFRVEGRAYPNQEYMPTGGRLVVPEGHWFVWPSSMKIFTNNAAAGREALIRVAVVPEDDLLGKPYRHWFWRKQLSVEGSGGSR